MLKTLILILFFLFSSYASAAKEITLNTAGGPPLNTPELTGFMDIVAKEAFQHIGYTLKTIQLPAERGLKNANAGIEDGEIGRIKGMEKLYPNLVRVPEKIMDWEFVAFSEKNIHLNNGWASLLPFSVSFINGWKILEKNVPKTVEVTKVRTKQQLFLMLSKKRADVILYERWGGLLYTRQHNLSHIKIQTPPLATREMFIYLHKKHISIVPKLAASLKKMKQDGRYRSIFNRILMPLK